MPGKKKCNRKDSVFNYENLLTTYLILSQVIFIGKIYAQSPPYPPSTSIKTIAWDYDSHIQKGQGSDQWPLTWSSDGQLYAAWGDGWGWDSLGIKRSMGVTRILGSPPDLSGHDLWGTGPGKGIAKPEALIALGDTLWMFWTVGDSKYDDHTFWLVWSGWPEYDSVSFIKGTLVVSE